MTTRVEELQRQASARPGVISLAGGLPADELLPRAALARASAATLGGRDGTEPLQYGWPEGCPALRAWIADRLVARGAAVDADDVIITAGAQQALALIAGVLPRQRRIIVDAETYPSAMSAFAFAGHDVVTEVGDVHYVIDGVSNPHGIDRVAPVRDSLLASGLPIIVDEAYVDLRFDGAIPRPLYADAPDRVWHVGTVSKVISPGLRVGWVDADPSLQHLLINAKQAMDTCTSVPAQRTVADFLAGGHLEPHLDRVLSLYRERKNAMRVALDRHFGDAVRATDPDGGFFLWVTFADSQVDTAALFEPALAEGVAYIPGPAFSTNGNFHDALRLCFATSTPQRIDEGVARLRAAVDRYRGHQ